MRRTLTIMTLTAVAVCLQARAGNLVLPVFAHNVNGIDGNRWSSEIYLTNPSAQPVQVTLADFLPGTISKPRPCDLFMSPTRVVPPRSAVVWTASGLATDLGCAETALGGLVLNADGPVQITSRTVNHPGALEHPPLGVLSGKGQEFEAVRIPDLPAPGTHLLPALMWHRNACGPPAFETYIGFANPGPAPATIAIDLAAEEAEAGVLVDGREVAMPHTVTVPAGAWRQLRLTPKDLPLEICLGPSSFVASVEIDAPLAVYASVVDRSSQDPRSVTPVSLR